MHPALEFKNVERLPTALRRDALPAYNGSLEHLKRLVMSLRGLQMAKDHSHLLIPVFHANLRTLHSIPVAEATLALESFDDILRAIASMEGLVLSSGFAEGVLVEIWPRFWHSFQVVYSHRASVTTRSETQILLTLLGFLGLMYDDHGYSFDVVSEVPGLRFFVARAWSFFLGQERHVDRLADDGGFEVITLFLRFSRPKDDSPNSIDELQVSRRSRALASVQEALFPEVTNLISPYIFLIASVLNTYPMYPWIRRGATMGMLPVFIRCCMRSDSGHHKETLVEFLTLLASSTVYRSVLRPLQDSVYNLREITASARFRQSVVIHEWIRFSKLLHSRFMLMCRMEDGQVVARNACDNMECGVIRDRTSFRCCSACRSKYYCSRDCQRRDWEKGDHRGECTRLRSNNFHDPWTLCGRNKLFIRALLRHDYMTCRDDILSQQKIIQQTHPGLQQSVVFNCNRLEVVVQVHPVRINTADDPPGLVDILSRASRSHGRMQLHMLLIDEGLPGGIRKRLISMRSNRSQIREIANFSGPTSLPDTEEMRDVRDQMEELEEMEVLYQ
ncbi:MYND-type domain-containing protein [Mycena venus]|uniref:MYND-type domain-containing protein n=1 Tax=Mycena venus TaxID=2733690 RepID=A0A8H7DCV1_9AGAR|nr:MYND-type domain-containing protein [Mycena venus]